MNLPLVPVCLCSLFLVGGVSIYENSWAQGNQSSIGDPKQSVTDQGHQTQKKEEELRRISQEIERRLGSGTRFVTATTPELSLKEYVKVIQREIEQKGAHNFPKRNGTSVYGQVLMAVTVNAKGQIERSELLEGSDRFLEAHARKLLKEIAGAPFPPDFPAGTQRIVFSARFNYKKD